MVKHTVPSRQFGRDHVDLVSIRQCTCQKTKITSLDNNNRSPAYVPTYTTRPMGVVNLSRPTQINPFSNTNLPFEQYKMTFNHELLSSNSIINKSKTCNSIDKDNDEQNRYIDQSKRRILTCKSILTILSVLSLVLLAVAALILPNILLYRMIPLLFQSPVNQTTVSEPVTYVKHCGGQSSYTQWIYYSGATIGIYMVVNTANCTFNTTPSYYTSIIGNTLRNDFTDYDAIYSATNILFIIYVRSYTGLTSAQMLNYSQTEKWNLSWIGVRY